MGIIKGTGRGKGRFTFPGKRRERALPAHRFTGRLRLSRRGQRALTVLTGMALTVGCCLLAEQYTGQEVETAGVPAISERVSGSETGKKLLILDYHQVLPTEKDAQAAIDAGEEAAIPLSAFKEDLSWLAEQGAAFILPSELKKAVQGIGELPEKAVLLTFDGGYESFYTVVWPQLRESGGKGCVGIIGSETDLYSGSVPKEIATSRLSWNQVRQMDQSDCVEIASMGYDLCLDAEEWLREAGARDSGGRLSSLFRLLNMKKNTGKAPVIPEENLLLYRAAVRKDALTMGEKLREALYHEADAFFVPAGFYDAEVDTELEEAGLCMTMTEGVTAGDVESVWNDISGHASLFGMTRILRPNDGSLKEYLSDYTS